MPFRQSDYLGSLQGSFAKVWVCLFFPLCFRTPAFPNQHSSCMTSLWKYESSICGSLTAWRLQRQEAESILQVPLCVDIPWITVLYLVQVVQDLVQKAYHVSAPCVHNKEMSTWLCGIHSLAARWDGGTHFEGRCWGTTQTGTQFWNGWYTVRIIWQVSVSDLKYFMASQPNPPDLPPRKLGLIKGLLTKVSLI